MSETVTERPTQDRPTRAAPSVRLAPVVAALPASVPFVGPEAQERLSGRPFAARAGANENGFGPSPRAIDAMAAAAAEAWMYGDPEVYDLRVALAARLGLGPAQIVVEGGVDGVLRLAVKLILAPGDVVVTSEGAYPTFDYFAAGAGARFARARYRDDRLDVPAMLDLARSARARIFYLANPDNPTGSMLPPETLLRMAAEAPADCLVLVDEAYVECAPAADVLPVVETPPNMLRVRTFSKAYALAGLRVGYGFGARPLVEAFERIRDHFAVGRVQQAGASAALADDAHLAGGLAAIARARLRLGEIGHAHGLTPLPSATNFVAFDTGRDGAFAARLLAALIARGCFVRKPSAAPLDRLIRISCAPDATLEIIAAALPGALAEADA